MQLTKCGEPERAKLRKVLMFPAWITEKIVMFSTSCKGEEGQAGRGMVGSTLDTQSSSYEQGIYVQNFQERLGRQDGKLATFRCQLKPLKRCRLSREDVSTKKSRKPTLLSQSP